MKIEGQGGLVVPERASAGGWFGPVGFATVVLVFSLLYVVVSVNDGVEPPVWWFVLGAWGFGALLAAFGGVARQVGVALIVASSAVVIPSSVFPILLALLYAVSIASICALAGGVPYLIWRRRSRNPE